jgi:hypothetical protein
MKKKTNAKNRKRQIAASKLKTRKSKPKAVRRKAPKRSAAKKKSKPAPSNRIVRIMGQGQFTVDNKTLKKLNDLDNSIVELVSQERSDDAEFRKMLGELSQTVVSKGKPLDPKAIIQSDIILPSADLSIDEAKRLFKGEGVIPEI